MTACRYKFYLLELKVSLWHSFASLTRERYLEHYVKSSISVRVKLATL